MRTEFKMCYKQVYCVLLICLVFFTIVKGSCLEYGHSCWGAHGKRSGGSVMRADSQLRNGELKKFQLDNFVDLTASSESLPERTSGEGTAKLKSLIRKNFKFPNSKNFDDAKQQNRNEMPQAARWRNMPLFNFKTLARTSSNRANGDNEIVPQSPQAASDDSSSYYDFQ